MLRAIAGSTHCGGTFSIPRTVRVSVKLCATVNAVIIIAYCLKVWRAIRRENRNNR
ncbi:hypothetical protein D3C81_2247010 [compost metagenome]